jgi:hypothetical protein
VRLHDAYRDKCEQPSKGLRSLEFGRFATHRVGGNVQFGQVAVVVRSRDDDSTLATTAKMTTRDARGV